MTEEAYLIVFYERPDPVEKNAIRIRCSLYNITKPQLSAEASTLNIDRTLSERALNLAQIRDPKRHEKAYMAQQLLDSPQLAQTEQECTLLPTEELLKLKGELAEAKQSLTYAKNELAHTKNRLIVAKLDAEERSI